MPLQPGCAGAAVQPEPFLRRPGGFLLPGWNGGRFSSVPPCGALVPGRSSPALSLGHCVGFPRGNVKGNEQQAEFLERAWVCALLQVCCVFRTLRMPNLEKECAPRNESFHRMVWKMYVKNFRLCISPLFSLCRFYFKWSISFMLSH